jgi:MoaA/NifB/PqqE/SkfB family radical SAM enzyme
VTHISYKIIDGAGVIYNPILRSDGKTYEAFQGPADTLCGCWWAKWRYEVLRDQNGEIYIWGHHKNVGDSEFLEHIASAKELAEIMFDDNKQQILEFDTGHWAVCLQEEFGGAANFGLSQSGEIATGNDCRAVAPVCAHRRAEGRISPCAVTAAFCCAPNASLFAGRENSPEASRS